MIRTNQATGGRVRRAEALSGPLQAPPATRVQQVAGKRSATLAEGIDRQLDHRRLPPAVMSDPLQLTDHELRIVALMAPRPRAAGTEEDQVWSFLGAPGSSVRAIPVVRRPQHRDRTAGPFGRSPRLAQERR